MVLDCEIASIVDAMLRGIPFDDEALALEAIAEVGPGGEYLTLPHTRKAMRGLWKATYMDRRTYGQWLDDPDKFHRDALEKARRLIREHQPEPLDPALDAELAGLVERHRRAALVVVD